VKRENLKTMKHRNTNTPKPLPTPAPKRTRRLQGGMSLIEVLVSVLVVSTGLLGAAALTASAMRNNQGSYERTQSSILTQGIFEAMRANLAAVNASSYNTDGWVCAVAADPASLAARDIARWVGTVKTQINADACGRIVCASGACTVSVRWDDSRSTGGASAQVISTRAQL
jgi:type IV pilus assembly protein PilV